MSAQVQDAVVRYTELKLSSRGYERMTVGWFGGEPLLAANIMRDIGHRLMDTAKKYGAGFSSNIQTNAYLLNQDMIDLLEEVNCRFAVITLDSYGSAHDATRHLIGGGGTFDRIIENLSSIRTKIPLNIRSNLDAESVDSYNRLRQTIYDIAEKTGNKMLCSPTYIHDTEASLERGYRANRMDFKRYAEAVLSTDLMERIHPYTLKASYCAVVQPDNYIIDDRGFVYAHCNEGAIDPERAYCNILELDEKNFDLPDKKHMEFAGQCVMPLELEKCMKCQLLPVCMGGCMLSRSVK